MSMYRHTMEFSSPTEDIFSWFTPENDVNRKDPPTKRKCDGDSGYMSSSVSPASGHKTSVRSYMLMTPDISSSVDRYGMNEEEPIYTPSMKLKTECIKKRLLQNSQDEKPSSLPNTPELDSFSDLITDTSLYNEAMDISIIKPNHQLDMIVEENLDVCETSKTIHTDVSMNSFQSEPVTPMRCMTPCDRLFKTPNSLKVSHSSPRKKKVFLKKKLSRPGSMIGSDFIDFFAHLGVRANFMIIAWKIIDLLSDQDISNMTMVSKIWRNICLGYPKAKLRWKNHVAERKSSKENLPPIGSGGKNKYYGTPEFGMSMNYITPFRMKQPLSPPVSPSKFRFHLFQKEASRLKEDEKLTDCPRCSLPSTVSPAAHLGRCTRIGCGLEFCSSCRSPYHGTRPCTTSTPASPQRPQPTRRIVGSKESKRFLRRL